MKRSLYFPLCTATVVLCTCIYYIHFFNLLGPYNLYNDSNDYYILSALGLLDGTTLPIVAHPGITLMSHLSWFLFLLHKASLVPAGSLSAIAVSEHPIRMLLDLFLAARVFSILTGFVYFFLVYLITVKITKNPAAACILVLFNVFSVGVLEHMFMIRSELLSVVYILLGVLLYMHFKHVKTIRKVICIMLAAGFCITSSILAKLQVIFFAPMFPLFFCRFLKNDYRISRETFVKYLLLFSSLTVFMTWEWTRGLNESFIDTVAPETKRSLALRFLPVALKVLWTFMGALFMVSLIPAMNIKSSRRLQFVRNTILCSWSLLSGMIIPLHQFYLTAAADKAAWAKKTVIGGFGETLYIAFFTKAIVEKTPSLNWSFLFNSQFQYILNNMVFFGLILAIGFITATKKSRVQLFFLCASLWFCSFAFAARGGVHFVYYYQVYYLAIMTLVLAICMKFVFRMENKKWMIVLAFASTCAFAVDTKKAADYRRELFTSPPRQESDLLAGLDYWGGSLFEKVFVPKFCKGINAKEKCYRISGSYYSSERKRYTKQ